MLRPTALIPAVVTTLLALVSPDAHAQSGPEEKPRQDVVREIERGFFLRANAGSTILVGPRSALLRPATTVDLTVGQDVLDKARASAGWEVTITQSIFNATFADYSDLIGSGIDPRFYVQGDTYQLGVTVGGGGQYYPVRRLGIGGHAGAGIGYFPLLIEQTAYRDRVVQDWGADPGLYNAVKFMAFGGVTLEYYTKLSHFSMGIAADFVYTLGFDYGIKAGGFFKYSF